MLSLKKCLIGAGLLLAFCLASCSRPHVVLNSSATTSQNPLILLEEETPAADKTDFDQDDYEFEVYTFKR